MMILLGGGTEQMILVHPAGFCSQNATLIRQPSRHGVSGKDFGVVRGSNQRKWEYSNQMQQKNWGYPL